MKILVSVKRVVDFNVKVRVEADGSGVETANVKMSMNPFDEIAVEEAVRLKEAGAATEIVVVSVRRAGRARRRCAPRSRSAPTARSWSRPTAELQPLAVAKLLKAVVEKEKPAARDPRQAGDRRRLQPDRADARRAPRLAAGDVRLEGEAVDGESAEVTREVDGGLETLSIKLPAVVTTDLRLNEPRYVTLPNIMKAKKKPLETLKPDALGVDVTPRLTTLKVVEPPKRKAGVKVRRRERAGREAAERSEGDLMAVLVLAEHDNRNVKKADAQHRRRGAEARRRHPCAGRRPPGRRGGEGRGADRGREEGAARRCAASRRVRWRRTSPR